MDSPIFGHSKNNKQIQKKYNIQEYNTDPAEYLPSQWHLTNKANNNGFSNSQISTQLKMAYTLLVLQKNIKTFFSKLNKCINRKKYQAFKNIEQNQNPNRLAFTQMQSKKKQINNVKQEINNPQTRMYTQICLKQTYHKLSSFCRIVNRIQLMKLSRGWTRILLKSERNRHFTQNSSHVFSIMQQTDLAVSSKIQSKKHLNSKKHAKQMKQNSLINRTNSDYETQNERLIQQISAQEYQLERFTAKMNNLLASHQNKIVSDSDRQTKMSDNLIYQNTFQNNNSKPINGTKSQLYTKKK